MIWRISRPTRTSFPHRDPTPGAGWTPLRSLGGSRNFSDYYLYHFYQVLKNEFHSKMHSWTCSCQGSTPGAGWTPPDVQLSMEIFQIATFIISSKFCKEKFAVKCIPGSLPIGVLPLGQGGRPQRSSGVWKYFQDIIWNHANRFCKKNFALKCIFGPPSIGVLPLGQGGRPPEVQWGLKIFSKYYFEQCQQVL